ncbi:MAG: IS982 family transposase [Pseudomonadales bacterium]|nr:IS982 family transposase [Pseudomonadales bacterium]
MTIDALYCDVDDFNRLFYPQWEKTLIESGEKKRRKKGMMTPSEVMTIIIHFHQSHYRTFKHYYVYHVQQQLKQEFPQLLSYTRFLEVMPSVLVPLCSYLVHCQGKPTGIAFIDSTTLKVCHNIRIPRHQVFKKSATRGKSTMGWFYGFKLHLVVNHKGEILAVKLTRGHVDDRTPVPELTQELEGKLYGDKGYISKALNSQLFEQGLEFITHVRKNMKPRAMALWDRIMLTKRYIIQTINDQLKNITQIEHSRHRSMHGFMLNLVGALIAYCHKKDKPTIRIDESDMKTLCTI